MRKALRWLVPLLILTVVAGGVLIARRSAESSDSNTAAMKTPTDPTLPPIQPCNPVRVAESTTLPASQNSRTTYAVVKEESCLSYGVREQLVGRPLPNMAVGVTSAIAGTLEFTNNGSLKPFTIAVDAGSFRSDERGRDGFVGVMLTGLDTAPVAEFVITEPGKNAVLKKGKATKGKLKGVLHVRGQEKEITVDVELRLDGDKVTITGTTQLKLTDIGITPPSLVELLTAENDVQLYVRVVAKKAP